MKRYLLAVCISSFGFIFANCSGNSLIDGLNTDGSVAIGELQISTVHHLEDGTELAANPDGTKSLTNDLGYAIELEEAEINWKSLKLVSAGDDEDCEAGHDQDLEINQSESFLEEDLVSALLSEQEIPMFAYCAYELTLAPGTDAAAIKNHEGVDHGSGDHAPIGESFHLAGTWAKDGASGGFHIDTTDPVTVAGVFHASTGEEHPLHFHEGETSTEVQFGTEYDALLKGVDFQAQNEDQRRDQVIANLSDAVHHDADSAH